MPEPLRRVGGILVVLGRLLDFEDVAEETHYLLANRFFTNGSFAHLVCSSNFRPKYSTHRIRVKREGEVGGYVPIDKFVRMCVLEP